ncbi:hypothetical protein [Paraconexibacter sp.]|uniref:hypothetical protein n=1 Tax=Paraconexibacter sp. TaxID=2949640 RepID=UPI00356655B0
MASPTDGPDPVTLRDAETARRIARAAAKGGPADRQPTPEQLLAAFEEPEATPEALRRVENALRFAGVEVAPPLGEATPGVRVTLEVRPLDPVPRGRAVRRGLVGLGALALLVAGVTLAAGVPGGDDERADVLPDVPVTGPTGPSGATGATGPTGATGTTAGSRSATTPTTTTSAAQRAAARKRAAERERAAERRRREAARRAAARRRVTVRLTPAEPTFLCVDDGAGRQLFNGTLTSRRTFTGRRIRLNVGLASTRVTINGERYRLSGSPDGVDITRTRRTPLPLGQRPCS